MYLLFKWEPQQLTDFDRSLDHPHCPLSFIRTRVSGSQFLVSEPLFLCEQFECLRVKGRTIVRVHDCKTAMRTNPVEHMLTDSVHRSGVGDVHLEPATKTVPNHETVFTAWCNGTLKIATEGMPRSGRQCFCLHRFFSMVFPDIFAS